MSNIRRAKTCESEILSHIAVESEAYWGYDSDYMERFKSLYKITKEFISENLTFVIQYDNNIIGFYGILINGKEFSLEYFFIEPKSIGKGYGKLLWNHMIHECENLNINKFVIVTSPQAKDFYMKMGALPFGEVASLLKKGRIIPRLIYTIEK